MALKKCEPEVPNYHLVRFDFSFAVVDVRVSGRTVVYEIEVFIPEGGT